MERKGIYNKPVPIQYGDQVIINSPNRPTLNGISTTCIGIDRTNDWVFLIVNDQVIALHGHEMTRTEAYGT